MNKYVPRAEGGGGGGGDDSRIHHASSQVAAVHLFHILKPPPDTSRAISADNIWDRLKEKSYVTQCPEMAQEDG